MLRIVKPPIDFRIKSAKQISREVSLVDGHCLYLRIKASGTKEWPAVLQSKEFSRTQTST